MCTLVNPFIAMDLPLKSEVSEEAPTLFHWIQNALPEFLLALPAEQLTVLGLISTLAGSFAARGSGKLSLLRVAMIIALGGGGAWMFIVGFFNLLATLGS